MSQLTATSGSTSWIGWEGWAFVGTVAQLLALLTVVGAAWRYLLLRRQMPLFRLEWRINAAQRQPSGDWYHVVEFRNVGRGIGHLMSLELVNARAQLEPGFTPLAVLGPNDSFQLLVSAPKIDDAWVRFVAFTAEDGTRWMITWRPLSAASALDDAREERLVAFQHRSLLERWRDWRRPIPVEPGKAPYAVLRTTRSRVSRVQALVPSPAEGVIRSNLVGAPSVTDLPYVPPRDVVPGGKTARR